jgi:hypothetical protein|nr:hypothetical protein Q903MT_gene5224 [Picea sitchensis]
MLLLLLQQDQRLLHGAYPYGYIYLLLVSMLLTTDPYRAPTRPYTTPTYATSTGAHPSRTHPIRYSSHW